MSALSDSWVALDWGTSSLRGARLSPRGDVLEERSLARGVLSVPAGQFPQVMQECFGDWARGPSTLCLIAGMAGSRQGWQEAPYLACPTDLQSLDERLVWVADAPPGWRVALVPGLSCHQDGLPDVMRGEEVQVLGAQALADVQDGVFVLPGTHSKWVRVEAGRVQGFQTWMTGEFFALLSRHSILSRTLPTDPAHDAAAFAEGVHRARRGPHLLNLAFSTRTLALTGQRSEVGLHSYLSGLLIGEELRAQGDRLPEEVLLIGAEALTERYAQALRLLGVASRCFDSRATWAGLQAIAQRLVLRLQ